MPQGLQPHVGPFALTDDGPSERPREHTSADVLAITTQPAPPTPHRGMPSPHTPTPRADTDSVSNSRPSSSRHYPSSSPRSPPHIRDKTSGPPPAPIKRLPRRHHVASCSSIRPPCRIPYFRSDPSSHRITLETLPRFCRLLFLHQRYSPCPEPATASASQTSPFVCSEVDEPLLVKPRGFDPSSLLAWIVFRPSRLVLLRLRPGRSYTRSKRCDRFRDRVYSALAAVSETTLCPPSQSEIITKIRSLHEDTSSAKSRSKTLSMLPSNSPHPISHKSKIPINLVQSSRPLDYTTPRPSRLKVTASRYGNRFSVAIHLVGLLIPVPCRSSS